MRQQRLILAQTTLISPTYYVQILEKSLNHYVFIRFFSARLQARDCKRSCDYIEAQ